MNNIYLIVGRSGVGKTTVVNLLRDRYGYMSVESYTDRPMRMENETGHEFLSAEEFNEIGEMVAYTEFDGHRYGATADMIEENDLYVIDPAGVDYFREHYHGEKGYRVIYLYNHPIVVASRIQKRSASEEEAARRLQQDSLIFARMEEPGACDISFRLEDSLSTAYAIHQYIQEQEKSSENADAGGLEHGA